MKIQLLLFLAFISFFTTALSQKLITNKSIFYPCKPTISVHKPANYIPGTMGGMYTYSEMLAELDKMHTLYPDLISDKLTIGSHASIEGRPMYYVIISDNPLVEEGEPPVLYTALHHAMEVISVQQMIYYMWYLLENYNTNPEIKYIVDNTRMFFVPCVNPDGYVYNETTNPNGGGTWRKNRRVNGLTVGVDLNRNYDYAFGYDEIGSSSLGWHPWYRGDSAFSEPETQFMKELIDSHDFRLTLNWHSYGDYVIYPWNFSGLQTQDSLAFIDFCRFFTNENHYRYGTVDQVYGYNSNGDADDWGYGIHHIMSMTAEAGTSDDGFWPDTSRIEPLCNENVMMNKKMALLSHNFALANDFNHRIINQTNGYLKFEVQCLGLDTPSTFTVSIIPVSSEITQVGNPVVFNNMTLLEERVDSISYQLNSNIQTGQELKYILAINNGQFTFMDTISKIFGPSTTAFYDNCENLSNWNAGSWNITSEDHCSGNYSITDSPNNNYSLFASSDISLIHPVDLVNASYADLSFHAKWDLERSYDWVELYASVDSGFNWIPLCGHYSSYGSDDQNFGEPLYDGVYKHWVEDEISLDDYLGQKVWFRFSLNSDQTHNFDGFYFDDFIVSEISQQSGINNVASIQGISIFPNPATEYAIIAFNESNRPQTLILYNSLGQQVLEKEISKDKNKLTLDTKNLSEGVYFLSFINENHVFGMKKMVIQKK